MRGSRPVIVWIAISLLPMWAQKASTTPRFEDYRVTDVFTGAPAMPILATSEEKHYGTRIRNGVLTGSDVWNGSWRNPIKSNGPNFAGHYFIIRWGCGSQCSMMATVDAKTGNIYGPPLSGAGSELYLPLDNLSDMEVDFKPDSSLLVLRNACKDFRNRSSCGVYYFNWQETRFVLLKFVMANPIKDSGR
jgi:hypothetical protein